MTKIEYSPESEWIHFPPQPGFCGCPIADGLVATTPHMNGGKDPDHGASCHHLVQLGAAQDQRPRLHPAADVSVICATFQAAHFRDDP